MCERVSKNATSVKYLRSSRGLRESKTGAMRSLRAGISGGGSESRSGRTSSRCGGEGKIDDRCGGGGGVNVGEGVGGEASGDVGGGKFKGSEAMVEVEAEVKAHTQ